jgi:hypothetical protein
VTDLKLPPVTHVYVGYKLKRLSEVTLEEARGVITELVDKLDAAEREITDLKKTRRKRRPVETQ